MTHGSKSIIELKNALFRPLADNIKKNVFRNPINLAIQENQRWAITGSRKLDLLHILASKHVANPPLSRTYHLGEHNWPSQVTQMVEFGTPNIKASHLSARYESFRDEFDNSLKEYLLQADRNEQNVQQALKQFKLDGIEDRWIVGLSNGQNRRARLAWSILKHPKLLIVDEPLLGLDPPSREKVSQVLNGLDIDVILGTRVQDELPEWITHVAVTDFDGISHQGTVEQVKPHLERLRKEHYESLEIKDPKGQRIDKSNNDTVVELDNVTVSYKGEVVFSNLKFEAKRGEKWHLQGPNGSGKSTLLALLTADHPQSWNSKIKLFNEPRKTGRQSYFSINESIGHSSPEIHSLFPGNLTVKQAISTGYVVGSFIPPKNLDKQKQEKVNNFIKEFELDAETPFNQLPLSDQKTVLFLRAIVKNPELLILDEAFSAMDEQRIAYCKNMLNNFDNTVIVVGHIESEIPQCEKFIRFVGDGSVVQGEL